MSDEPTQTAPMPQRLLVRGVNWLGDAVMSTPALLRLREALPQAHITLLTPEKLADLWQAHPALDAVLTFAPGDFIWQVARRLRAECFDLSLILPNSTRSALECHLARIPQRIGYSGRLRSLLLTHPISQRFGVVKMRRRSKLGVQCRVWLARSKPRWAPPPSAHHIHQYLHLAAALGANAEPPAPQLHVSPNEVTAALDKFGLQPDSPASPLIGLNPAAEYGPAKRWPGDRFASVLMTLHRQTNCRWIIFGGLGDRALADEISGWTKSVAAAHPVATSPVVSKVVWNLAEQTSLRELCAVLKACRALLTNDTGPMHVAAALGTPVIVPFGSTSPELTGPGLPGDPRHRFLTANVSCAPCFRRECPIDFRCMNRISVPEVIEAVRSVIEQA